MIRLKQRMDLDKRINKGANLFII